MENNTEQVEKENIVVKKTHKKLYLFISIVLLLFSIGFLFIGIAEAAIGPFFLAIILLLKSKKG